MQKPPPHRSHRTSWAHFTQSIMKSDTLLTYYKLLAILQHFYCCYILCNYYRRKFINCSIQTLIQLTTNYPPGIIKHSSPLRHCQPLISPRYYLQISYNHFRIHQRKRRLQVTNYPLDMCGQIAKHMPH